MIAQPIFNLAAARAVVVFLGLGLCATLLGCDKKPSDTTPITINSSTPLGTFNEDAAAKPALPVGMRADDKVQDYIACYNSLSANTQDSIASYAIWVKNMEIGPSGKEKTINGITPLDVDRINQCTKALAFVASQAPSMPELDTASLAYMNALANLTPMVAEAHSYYETEAYKADGFTRGRSFHKPLVQQFSNVQSAGNTLAKALDTQNDALLSTHLQEVEQTQGRNMTYWQLALMRKAKPLARMLSQPNFDSTAAASLLIAYESVADDTLAYTKTHIQESSPGWQALTTAGTNMRIAAQQRVQRVREKVDYSAAEKRLLKTDKADTVNGSAEGLIKAYNNLVEANNNL